jgi:hypothetical protein
LAKLHGPNKYEIKINKIKRIKNKNNERVREMDQCVWIGADRGGRLSEAVVKADEEIGTDEAAMEADGDDEGSDCQ